MIRKNELTEEQKNFIDTALDGNNILVEACIGSGKTTAIQMLCNELPKDKHILYLTFNASLKSDARARIKVGNTDVHNYNAFAYNSLIPVCGKVGTDEQIKKFNEIQPIIPIYDVLIIDEYQDIDSDISTMLNYIKSKNPSMQIIAVGDMDQKIYNKSILDVSSFIDEFLGCYKKLSFTYSFRVCSSLAHTVGRMWKKNIKGVNDNCVVENIADVDKIVEFLSDKNPKDVLVLRANKNSYDSSAIYNALNGKPNYNKNSMFSEDRSPNANECKNCALFLTYDRCKGLERKYVVVCGFTEECFNNRLKASNNFNLIRNLFCVAATRGKNYNIFFRSTLTEEKVLEIEHTYTKTESNKSVNINTMFDYRPIELLDNCKNFISVEKEETTNDSKINVDVTDGCLDLTHAVDVYIKSVYFDNYSIDDCVEQYFIIKSEKNNVEVNKQRQFYKSKYPYISLWEKSLFVKRLITDRDTYTKDVEVCISEQSTKKICKRLATRFSKKAIVQAPCKLNFSDITVRGLADVVEHEAVTTIIYNECVESSLYLCCAMQMLALEKPFGFVWNIKDNSVYKVTITDKDNFVKAVTNLLTYNN